MYETVTYEKLLARLLGAAPDNVDTREGSVIYDALAPIALELEHIYIELDVILQETFADSSSREYLIRRAKERGLSPYEATCAKVKGRFDQQVKIGDRFYADEICYTVESLLNEEEAVLVCETPGIAGNMPVCQLAPAEFIKGLTKASLTEVIVPGRAEESTDAFRQRYFDSLHPKAYGGNIEDYKEKVLALPGVGAVKVYPVYYGGGTVRLVLLDAEMQAPSEELLEEVQTAVDPVANHGEGLGIAPIGHVVTVEGAVSVPIKIQMSLLYEEGWSTEDVLPYMEETVEEYFNSLRQDFMQAKSIIVRISQLETRILALEGILDVGDTMLNGRTGNLTLGTDEIPIKGEIYAKNNGYS